VQLTSEEHSKESFNLLLRNSHNKSTVLLHQRKKKTLVRELCISYSKFSQKKKSPVCNINENLVRKATSRTENSHKKSQFAIRVAWSGNAAAMRHFRPDLHRHRRLRKELLIHSERTMLI